LGWGQPLCRGKLRPTRERQNASDGGGGINTTGLKKKRGKERHALTKKKNQNRRGEASWVRGGKLKESGLPKI